MHLFLGVYRHYVHDESCADGAAADVLAPATAAASSSAHAAADGISAIK